MACARLAYLTVKFAETLKVAQGAKLIITSMQIIPAHHAQQTVLFVALQAVTNALLASTITMGFARLAL